MCCPINQSQGHFLVKSTEISHGQILVKGKVELSPKNTIDKVLHCLKQLEIAEKIAEIVDETFHFFGSFIKPYASVEIYDYLKGLHDGAHHLEHGLHAFCFIGDVVRIIKGNYVEKNHGHIDYVRTASRVMHTVSNFFATSRFLSELKVISLGRFNAYLKYTNLISAIGFTLWTASLLWKRFVSRQHDHNFSSNLAIHGAGGLFEGLNFVKQLDMPNETYRYVSKTAAFFGIIHAWTLVSRLAPSSISIEPFRVSKNLPVKAIKHDHETPHEDHNNKHKHTHACNHAH